jgi:hypothetical protein
MDSFAGRKGFLSRWPVRATAPVARPGRAERLTDPAARVSTRSREEGALLTGVWTTVPVAGRQHNTRAL